ncbi:transglutaminaseTgpA domain-containing protein [Nocardioides sp. Kera G14]|uniref:transglutaminase family protein n=1 Tax=Nocardioides sp. Kera G14 TaxID=2884264 RepID=UPI001D0F4D7E|nr:DUF3488 and transglutaminase-like domain-containing protein [Nocardioides sp. Kera G14]UDY22498.1 transglutaminaseTgpA domain-containing protein [Nocardioides sp. Kera G14]
MRDLVRVAVATVLACVTAWTAALSWQILTIDDGTWIGPSVFILVLVAAVGIGMRAARAGALLTLLVQLLLGLALICWELTRSPLPLGGRAVYLADMVRHAIDLSTRLRPPVPVEGGVQPIMLGGVLLAILVIDFVAVGLRRPALAGAGLLGIWSVIFWNGPVHLSAWAVALPTAGFCVMLLQQNHMALSRWGRGFGRPFLTTGATLGAVAVLAAVVVPKAVPTTDLHLLKIGHGSGTGSGLTVDNPMTSMRKELIQGPDDDLLTVTTKDPHPEYLRVAVLTNFRNDQWTPGERSVPATNVAGEDLPLTGVGSSVGRTTYTYDVTATRDFDSRWLPTQSPITALQVDGNWRYDVSTMDFLAGDKGLTTSGRSWSMSGVQLDLTSDLMSSVLTNSWAGVKFQELPDDFPSSVENLATQVTAGAQTPFAKAVTLQNWFRSTGGFVYDTSTDLGDGTDDLSDFLFRSKAGFCQQFSAAMAAMARSLGIPARVAVGFLRPEQTGDDTWVYSAHDLHAWPELYFQGAGWVRFEPTPSVRAPEVPSYTEKVSEQVPAPSVPASPTAEPTKTPAAPPAEKPIDETPTATTPADSHRTLFVSLGLGLLVILLLVLPASLRRLRRRRRLARSTPEDLWAELRDTAVDLGAVWPEEASVRRQAAAVRVSGDAGQALGRLVTVLEESRYAPQAGRASGSAELEAVRSALWENAGPRAKRRARALPPSLFR